MSTYNRRYAVLQDPNLKTSDLETVKSVTGPPADQPTKEEMHGESYLDPHVEKVGESTGDISITASGEVLPTFSENTADPSTYVYEPGSNPRKTAGEGFIQTDGSSDRSRFSFIKEGQSNYQFRATPNYFGKVPFTLRFEQLSSASGTVPKAQCFTRPELLSLKNGNLLCAYLNSYSPQWMWSFQSGLLDPLSQVQMGLFTVQSYNAVTRVVTVTPATWTAEITVNRYFTQNPADTEPTYARIIAFDAAAKTFTIEDNGSSAVAGVGYVYNVGRFENRPAQNTQGNVKLRLSVSKDQFWSDENDHYPLFPDLNPSSTDWMEFGATGISLVQFPDTEEVLLVSCGYVGNAKDFVNNASYLNVDKIQSSFDSYTGFAAGISDFSLVERRSSLSLNKTAAGMFGSGSSTDIANLEAQTVPLAMTAEVLPSGRLVVVVAMNDKLLSLVSDDRGVSFGANEIMDLRFGTDNEYQQFCGLDSVVAPSGDMVILLTANSLGDRGPSGLPPSANDSLGESVVSIFTSATGEAWSSEKRLGGGSYPITYSMVDNAGVWPTNIGTHVDESIYALSGSICMTPEGNILVSLCTLNIGGIAGHQGCHLYQRVLSTDEIKFGDSGLDIAPSLPSEIFTYAGPLESAISRASMALPYFGGARDNAYSTMPALQDYFDFTFESVTGAVPTYSGSAPHDRGYLGSLFFAGIRNSTDAILEYLRCGGGPILIQGPIDVATCLHRGEIVSAVCEGWETEPSDSPRSTGYLRSRTIVKTGVQRGVQILYSGGLQPLRVNLPTELRRFEGAYDVAGRLMDYTYMDSPPAKFRFLVEVYKDTIFASNNYVDMTGAAPPGPYEVAFFRNADLEAADISGGDRVIEFSVINNLNWAPGPRFTIVGRSILTDYVVLSLSPQTVDDDISLVYDGYGADVLELPAITTSSILDVGMVFGSNCYQVALLGAKDPQYWGWQRSHSGINGSLVSDSDSGVTYANKWEIDAPLNEHLNYSFDKDYSQSEAYGAYTFPNLDGELLKSSYPAERDALSFVQRTVFQLQFGGNRRSSSVPSAGATLDYGLRCSARVFLRDSERASGNFLSLGLSISRDGDDVYLRLIKESWNGAATEYTPIGDEVSFVDQGDGTDVSEKVPYYEVVWGVKPEGALDTYTVFLYARPWRRYADPQFINDFTKMDEVNITSDSTDPQGNNLASSTAAEFVSYGAFDTTLDTATKASFPAVQFSRSFLEKSPCFAMAYSDGDLGSGLFDFREILHIPQEPALDFLRFYNAGQMSPMSPPMCRSHPQVVDNGVELSFRGRTTGGERFSYSGKSRFPARSVFSAPVKDGWRSPTETLTFTVPSENALVDLESPRLPAYEMIFDAGSQCLNPESLSFFGINTGGIIVDFSNSSTFGMYGAVGQPHFTMLFAAPGHPSSLFFNYWANSIQQEDTPPADAREGDLFLVGPAPTGAWVGLSGALVKAAAGGLWTVEQNPYVAQNGDTVRNRTPGSDLDMFRGFAGWGEVYATVPRIFYKPLYLMHFQAYGIRYRSASTSTLSETDIRWYINPDTPSTVTFTTGITDTADMSPSYAPFRPGQFKSQSNENFYLLVVDRQAGEQLALPYYLRTEMDAKYCYYYKIIDNGTDYLTLDRSIADTFRTNTTEASNDGKLAAGSMTILSDRAAANSPDLFTRLGDNTFDKGVRFRYMRITVTGGEHSEDSLRLGMSICGQRLDLSNPDFSLDYTYDLESGSSLFDSIAGRRKSRRNHKPRKSFGVSYEPRPSAQIHTVTTVDETDVMNTRRGYGNIDNPVVNPAQAQEVQRLSWQELVERVLSIGIDGGVLALGFDGNNMQTLSGTVENLVPREFGDVANLKPALSDPHGLCAARLTGFQGATNVAYQHQSVIGNSQGGSGSSAGAPGVSVDPTGCVPAAVMSIKGLKFTEEL